MNRKPAASHRILGTLYATNGQGLVRLEDRFNTDIHDLWSALTEPPRLSRWIAETKGAICVSAARFTVPSWSPGGKARGGWRCEPPAVGDPVVGAARVDGASHRSHTDRPRRPDAPGD